jgi:hypothetical protein
MEKNKENEISPFIIRIENTENKIIENVSVFENNDKSNFLYDGSYFENGILIASHIPTFTYKGIIEEILSLKAHIDFTYLFSPNVEQILEKFSIIQKEGVENYISVIAPKKEENQIQQNIVRINQSFFLDSDTSIVIDKIYPKTVLILTFFPKKK